jgi:hypothetical protein
MGFAGTRVTKQYNVCLTGKVCERPWRCVLRAVRRDVRLTYSSSHLNLMAITKLIAARPTTVIPPPSLRERDHDRLVTAGGAAAGEQLKARAPGFLMRMDA